MIRMIKKISTGLLIGLANTSIHTKCFSLKNQRFNHLLYTNEFSQEFHYYLFKVKLDKSVGSFNSLNNLSNKICVSNKTEDLKLSVFNMIWGINETEY